MILVILFVLVSTTGIRQAWSAEEDYYGTYAGTFSGDDNGVWISVIDSETENLFLSYSTDSGLADGAETLFFDGTGDVGQLWGTVSLYATSIDLSINPEDDTVSGQWESDLYGNAGSLTGSRVSSNDYAGSYSGTFTGELSGTWSFEIDSDGYLTGSAVESDTSYPFVGACHPDGYVVVFDEFYSIAASGQISGGSLSGTWYADQSVEGTFSGSAANGDVATASDSDGGGGCFISQMIGTRQF